MKNKASKVQKYYDEANEELDMIFGVIVGAVLFVLLLLSKIGVL